MREDKENLVIGYEEESREANEPPNREDWSRLNERNMAASSSSVKEHVGP